MDNSRIHVLDVHTANQIAAGEVVERPSSVVKELVENAIDAGASTIDVHIFDEECQKIMVADNGCGMSPAEMRLAVQRHATSKIRKAADLEQLTTLGFRGEALPAIAAVSHFTITSKIHGADYGYSMAVDDGKAGIPVEAAAKNGTVILVDKLFYNAPARRKFLKSPRTELGAVSDLLVRLAICRPDISFTFKQGNKNVFSTSGNGNIDSAVLNTYGRDTVNNMIKLEHLSRCMIHGLISLPTLSRGNRKEYNFFINGRLVKSKEISQIVDEAYYTVLPAHRYPLVFLFFELAPNSVDVNVHPAKLEVKLREPNLLREELSLAIKEAFNKKELLTPRLGNINRPLSSISASTDAPQEAIHIKEKPRQAVLPLMETGSRYNLQSDLYGKTIYQNNNNTIVLEQSVDQQDQPTNSYSDHNIAECPDRQQEEKRIIFSMLRPLGQANSSYIFAEGEEGIYIIDQHAAAERIMYEKILAIAAEQPSASNILAIPQAVELTFQERLLLTDSILELKKIGIILEYFGDNSFIIRGIPIWYLDNDPEHLLRTLLDELAENKGDVLKIRQDQLFMAACKQAVKANRRLSSQDINALLKDLDACENPFTCPHGRPTIIKLDFSEIRKRFLRSSI